VEEGVDDQRAADQDDRHDEEQRPGAAGAPVEVVAGGDGGFGFQKGPANPTTPENAILRTARQ
jgi:hypothetical protein